MLASKGLTESRAWLTPLRDAATFSLLIFGVSFILKPVAPVNYATPISIIANLTVIALYCSKLSKTINRVKSLPSKEANNSQK